MHSQETNFEIPESRYLRSGQFAALCRTTKDTLRHYRAIGLIEPVLVSDNGYAYYSPLQLGDFMLVAVLQRAGSSLAGIRRYLEDPQAPELEAMISECIDRLEAEHRALRDRQRFLQKTLDRSRTLSKWLTMKDNWRVVDMPEERFYEIDVSALFSEGGVEPEQERRILNDLVDTGRSLIDQGMASQMQGCYRVGLQALLEGHPEQDFHLCICSTPFGRRHTRHTRPPGRYYQRLRCASIDNLLVSEGMLFNACKELVDEVKGHGFIPVGDLYEQELSLYTGDITAESYTEMSIRIE